MHVEVDESWREQLATGIQNFSGRRSKRIPLSLRPDGRDHALHHQQRAQDIQLLGRVQDRAFFTSRDIVHLRVLLW